MSSMKIEGIVPRVVWQNLPQNVSWQRVALIALPLIALVGVLFWQIWGSSPPAKKPATPEIVKLQDVFNRVIDLQNHTRPKIRQGNDYEFLKSIRIELQPQDQQTLFYAELLSDGDITPQMVEQVKQTFLNPPAGGWNDDIKSLYHSFSNRHQAVRYGSHYEAQTKLEKVVVKGQTLTKQVIKDNGDCLFETILEGYTGTERFTANNLRQLASQSLLKTI